MKVSTNFDGYPLVDSARVYLIPCPTGDSLVDNEAIRRLLGDIWAQSNPSQADSLRIERGGYVFRDSLGKLVYRTSPVNTTLDTPCKNANTPAQPLPGTRSLLRTHIRSEDRKRSHGLSADSPSRPPGRTTYWTRNTAAQAAPTGRPRSTTTSRS